MSLLRADLQMLGNLPTTRAGRAALLGAGTGLALIAAMSWWFARTLATQPQLLAQLHVQRGDDALHGLLGYGLLGCPLVATWLGLSLGQRQLVALSRVLAQRPAIFILDEATASIDPFTERQIQDALKQILADSTSILIAHRLSTVKAADRILVLQQGSVIEEGSHDGLMAQGGHYASLYDTYFRHQSADFNAEMFAARKK